MRILRFFYWYINNSHGHWHSDQRSVLITQFSSGNFTFLLFMAFLLLYRILFCGRTVWIEWFLFMDRKKRGKKIRTSKIKLFRFHEFSIQWHKKERKQSKNGNLCTFTHQFLLLYYLISLLFFDWTCLVWRSNSMGLATHRYAWSWIGFELKLVGRKSRNVLPTNGGFVCFFLFFSCSLFMFGGRKHW